MLPRTSKYDRPTSSVAAHHAPRLQVSTIATSSVLAAHHAPRLQVSTIAPHLATAHHAPRLQVSTIAPHLAYSLPIMLPVYK